MTTEDFFYVPLGKAKKFPRCNIDDSCLWYGDISKIVMGLNVRIDAHCIISAGEGGVFIGNHVHLGAGTKIYGTNGEVVIEDFAGTSPNVSLFTATEDLTGHLTGPCVPEKFKRIKKGPIAIRRHATIGAHSVVLPGVTIGTGAAVGALSLIRKNVADYMVVVVRDGVQHVVRYRDREMMERLEKEFLQEFRW